MTGFLQSHRAQFKVSDASHSRPKTATNGVGSGRIGKPSRFWFNDESYPVGTWKEVLVKFCEVIYVEKQNEFGRVMNVREENKQYFSKNPDDLDKPELIGDSGIFAATAHVENRESNNVAKECYGSFATAKTASGLSDLIFGNYPWRHILPSFFHLRVANVKKGSD